MKKNKTWDDFVDKRKHFTHWLYVVGYVLIGVLIVIGVLLIADIYFHVLCCVIVEILEKIEGLLIGLVPAYFALIIAKTQEERDLAGGVGIPQLGSPQIVLIDKDSSGTDKIENLKEPPHTDLIGIFEFETSDLYWRGKVEKFSLVIKTFVNGEFIFKESVWKATKSISKSLEQRLEYRWEYRSSKHKTISKDKKRYENTNTSRLLIFCICKDETFWKGFRKVIPKINKEDEFDETDILGINLCLSFQSGIIKTKKSMKVDLFFKTLPKVEENGEISFSIIDCINI